MLVKEKIDQTTEILQELNIDGVEFLSHRQEELNLLQLT